jgi:hypothetical protein
MLCGREKDKEDNDSSEWRRQIGNKEESKH